MIFIATVMASGLLLKKLLFHGHIFIENGPMLLFAAVTFLGGLQFLGFGLLGDLVARLYYAPNERNIYNVARVYQAELPESFEKPSR